MKMIYLTDIHGMFSQVATLLFETIADVYVIGGDLIDIPFYNLDTAIYYHDQQTFFQSLRKKMEKEDMVMEEFVDYLMEFPDTPEDILNRGSSYQEHTIRARRVMQQKYKVLENIISFKTSSWVYTIPGNYDMDLKFTSLHERDLHLHWYNVFGMKIAGYGGADVRTTGIPEKYVVKYAIGIGKDTTKNEMYTFFKAIKPDIIVSHQPAHGIHDRITHIGPSGSPALRMFCDNNPVKLCLTGHIHNDWGFKFVEDTVYLNPSNFGDVTTVKGEVAEGGFFYQIEIDDNKIERISLKKMANDKIYDIAEHTKKNGSWTGQIIDQERYNAKLREENVDLKVKKYHHIPEIELFKEIKQFFRLFQTQETEIRIDKLEKAMELLGDRFFDVAMDITGSVNVGLSQRSSDIDIVLYLRCKTECGDMYETCENFREVKGMIAEILGDEFKFEIVDCVNLNIVEQSIRERNYECELTQRFVAYRSICRPVNYKVISPIEDLLNQDIEFRKEMEGSIRSFFRIFATTSQHIRSFEKYKARLKTIGIKIPDVVQKKIRQYLQQEDEGGIE